MPKSTKKHAQRISPVPFERAVEAVLYWTGQMEALRANHKQEIGERDATIERLRRQLDEAQTLANRRGAGMAEVYRAYLRERRLHDSEKATEAALNERFGARESAHGAPPVARGP